jgi:esterase/lipase superfamily enzyme
MARLDVYFATNRRHRGRDRWNPSGYGTDWSRDGAENLRFGRVSLQYDARKAAKHLQTDVRFGSGDGSALADYLSEQRDRATIEAFEESLDKREPDTTQGAHRFGSTQLLGDLQIAMREQGCDVLVYIHGFKVSWWDAVGSAASLELMLNHRRNANAKYVRVVLFTWPSDGAMIPYWSYFSDRSAAATSGAAVGRAFLKLRDYLIEARREDRESGRQHCPHAIHLLCHSMGNYVLQNMLARVQEFSVGGKPPRIFEHVFLCAADVADDVFEPNGPLRRLPEMAANVSIYHNAEDVAMPVSDYTKGNSDRLGWRGVSRPAELDGRVHQVDCTPIVTGLVEHDYYRKGRVSADIRQSIDGVDLDHWQRHRVAVKNGWPNIWRMR